MQTQWSLCASALGLPMSHSFLAQRKTLISNINSKKSMKPVRWPGVKAKIGAALFSELEAPFSGSYWHWSWLCGGWEPLHTYYQPTPQDTLLFTNHFSLILWNDWDGNKARICYLANFCPLWKLIITFYGSWMDREHSLQTILGPYFITVWWKYVPDNEQQIKLSRLCPAKVKSRSASPALIEELRLNILFAMGCHILSMQKKPIGSFQNPDTCC